MPVTAKLSRAFYDKFGDQIANDLVEWFDKMDQTYRNDLRDLNELNFQRFSGRLDERVGASESKVEVRLASFESNMERRMTEFESRMERRMTEFESRMEQRMTEFESEMKRRITSFESNMEQRFAEFKGALEQRMSGLEATLERRLAAHTRWTFAVWAALFIPIIGLWFRG